MALSLMELINPQGELDRRQRAEAEAKEQRSMQIMADGMGVGNPALQQIAQMRVPDREKSFDQASRYGRAETEEDYQRLFSPKFRQQSQPNDLQGIANQAPPSPAMMREEQLIRSGDKQAFNMGMQMRMEREGRERQAQAAQAQRAQELADRDEMRMYQRGVLEEGRGYAESQALSKDGRAPKPRKIVTVNDNQYYQTDDGGLEAVQEPPEIVAARQAENMQELQNDYADFNSQYDTISKLMDATEAGISEDSTGSYDVYTMDIPGLADEDAIALRGNLDTLKSKLAIDIMTELKAQSSTGSTGFGALSEKELDLLTSQVAKLDQSMSPEALKAQLNTVRAHYARLKEKSDRSYRQAGGKVAPMAPKDADTVDMGNGWSFKKKG